MRRIGKTIVLNFSDSEESIMDRIMEIVKGKGSVEYARESIQNTLTFPDLEIHVHAQLVYQDRILIPMSHHEFFTLLYLAQHPNWVFSKEQIYKAVWKESGDGGAAVTNVMSQIRRKIGDSYIKTVIGSGYKFEV